MAADSIVVIKSSTLLSITGRRSILIVCSVILLLSLSMLSYTRYCIISTETGTMDYVNNAYSNTSFSYSVRQGKTQTATGKHIEDDDLESSIRGRGDAKKENQLKGCNIRKPQTQSSLDGSPSSFLEQALNLDIPAQFCSKFVNPCWYRQSEEDRPQLVCLPYFLLAGMPKSATTDLYGKLTRHPQIMALGKEPHWWTRRRFSRFEDNLEGYNQTKTQTTEKPRRTFLSPLETYLRGRQKLAKKLDSNSTVQEVGADASASTFWDNHLWRHLPGNEEADEPQTLVAHHIKKYLPHTKVVVLFRNPVTRLFSDALYFNFRTLSPSPLEQFHNLTSATILSFNECLKTKPLRNCVYSEKHKTKIRLHVGLYVVYLRDWLQVYPRRQIHVVRTEEYSANTIETLNGITEFLGLDEYPKETTTEILDMNRANSLSQSKGSGLQMLPETRDMLRDFYAPYNQQLADLLQDNGFLWNED